MNDAGRITPWPAGSPGNERRVPFNLADILVETAAEADSLASKLPAHVEGEVIVKLRPGRGSDLKKVLMKDYNAGLRDSFEIPANMKEKLDGELMVIKLPEGMTVPSALAAMKRDPRIEYASSNDILYGLESAVSPDDPGYGEQWGLSNTGQNYGKPGADIHARQAWVLTKGRTQAEGGPLVAILDSGVDYTHPDLKGNLWTNPGESAGDHKDNDGNWVIDDVHGYNTIDDSGDPMDDHSHGTHCAGIIGAVGNNGQGVSGVNWKAAMMGVKFLNKDLEGDAANAIKGILYASKMGARVISHSWGGGEYNEALKNTLAASPALHIIAAGNSHSDNDAKPFYPACYDLPNVITVAATDNWDELAYFSNYGAKSVDIAAPGAAIYSTVPGNNYRYQSGSSMAAPFVAGAVALMLSQYPGLTNSQIITRLLYSADRLPSLEGKVASERRLNVARALENDTTPPAAPSDFKAKARKNGEVQLRWTATGDDWKVGRTSYYDIRCSDRPIFKGTPEGPGIGFEDAKPVAAVLPDPSDPGTKEMLTVTIPPAGEEKMYYFAIRVGDNTGNLSDVSTAAVIVPARR